MDREEVRGVEVGLTIDDPAMTSSSGWSLWSNPPMKSSTIVEEELGFEGWGKWVN